MDLEHAIPGIDGVVKEAIVRAVWALEIRAIIKLIPVYYRWRKAVRKLKIEKGLI